MTRRRPSTLRPCFPHAALTALLTVFLAWAGPAAAEVRHALIMGVWDYTDPTFPGLPQTGIEADLQKMTAKLTELGFTVTPLMNPTLKQAKKAVDDFGTLVKSQPGTALFYFSGHGSEYDGKNFLIPAGTEIVSNRDLDDEALSANRVLDRMEESGGQVNIVFLDCCRNSMSKGAGDMASMEANGTFIGYATRGGKVSAASAEGSFYTASLLRHIGTPGMSITDMHTMVTREVKAQEPTQVPHQYSGLDQLFFFKPGAPDASGRAVNQMPATGTLGGLASIARSHRVGTFGIGFSHRPALGEPLSIYSLPMKEDTVRPDLKDFKTRDVILFDADPWRGTTVGENSRTSLELSVVPKLFKDDPGAADEDPGYMSGKAKRDAVAALDEIYAARSLNVKGRRFVDHGLAIDINNPPPVKPGKPPMGFWWGGPDYQRDSVAPSYIESQDGTWRGIARFINSGQDFTFSPYWQAVMIAKNAEGSIVAVIEIPCEEVPEAAVFKSRLGKAQKESEYSVAVMAGYAFLGDRAKWENTKLGDAVRDGEALAKSLVLKP